MEPLQTAGLMPGPYKVPAMRYRTCGVATNKTPVGPYRAVGRPTPRPRSNYCWMKLHAGWHSTPWSYGNAI